MSAQYLYDIASSAVLTEMTDAEVEELLSCTSPHLSPKIYSRNAAIISPSSANGSTSNYFNQTHNRDDVPSSFSSRVPVPSDALVPLSDGAVLEKEAMRFSLLVQEEWYHQSARYLRWNEEVERRGNQYRPQPIAATCAVNKTHSKSLCIVLNVDPSWLGVVDEVMDEDSSEEDGPTPPVTSGDTTEGVTPLLMWMSPSTIPGDPASVLNKLGKQLEQQYAAIAPRQLPTTNCLNMKPAELSQSLSDVRKEAGDAKVILHYFSRGVRPSRGGNLYLSLLDSYTSNGKIPLDMLRARVDKPLVFIADCPDAGEILRDSLKRREEADNEKKSYSSRGHQFSSRQLSSMELDGMDEQSSKGSLQSSKSSSTVVYEDFLFIGATGMSSDAPGGRGLVQHPRLPSDILTSCLTTPVHMAVLWFMAERPDLRELHPVLLHLLPGTLNDKKTPLGQLQWAFTSITDCIAWSSLSLPDFSRLFREDVHVAPLFRGYLLAERIIVRGLGGSLSVHPPLPVMHEHSFWDEWENFVERACVCLYRAMKPIPPVTLNVLEYREWLDSCATAWKYQDIGRRDATTLNHGVSSPFAGLSEVVPQARREYAESLPIVDELKVRLPNFFHEQLRGVQATIDCVSRQSFSKQRGRDPVGSSNPITPQEPFKKSLYKPRVPHSRSIMDLRNQTAAASSVGGQKKSITWDAPPRDPSVREEYVGNVYASTTNSSGNRNSERSFPFLDHLPMLVQGLLVVAFREKSTELVARLVDVGTAAVLQCTEANMFRLVLDHYWTRKDLYYLMPSTLFIFTKACYADPALIGGAKQRDAAIGNCIKILQCPVQLPEIKHAKDETPGAWQQSILGPYASPTGQRLMAVSLLVMLASQGSEATAACFQMGAFQLCCQLIESLAVVAPLYDLFCAPSDADDVSASAPRHLEELEVLYISNLLSLFIVLLSEWRPPPTSTVGDDEEEEQEETSDAEEEKIVPLDGIDRLLPRTTPKIVQDCLLLALPNLNRMLYSPIPVLRGISLRCFALVLQLTVVEDVVATKYASSFLDCVSNVKVPFFEGNLDLVLELLGATYTCFRWLLRQLKNEFSKEELWDFVAQWLYRWSVRTRKGEPQQSPRLCLDVPADVDPGEQAPLPYLSTSPRSRGGSSGSGGHSFMTLSSLSPAGAKTFGARSHSNRRHNRPNTNYASSGISLVNSSFVQRRSSSPSHVRRQTLPQACLAPFSNLVRIILGMAQNDGRHAQAHARKIILEEFDFLVSRWFRKGGNPDDNTRSEWTNKLEENDDGSELSDENVAHRSRPHFTALIQAALGEGVLNGRSSWGSEGRSGGAGHTGDAAATSAHLRRLNLETIQLRCFGEQEGTTVRAYVYRSLSYLASMLLVPLDDYDVHHVVQRRKQDDLYEHMFRCAEGLREYNLYELQAVKNRSNDIIHVASSSRTDAGSGREERNVGGRSSNTNDNNCDGDGGNTSHNFEIVSREIPGGCGRIQNIVFHPSKNLILSSTDQGYVQSWRCFSLEGKPKSLELISSYNLSGVINRHISQDNDGLRHLYSLPQPVYAPQDESIFYSQPYATSGKDHHHYHYSPNSVGDNNNGVNGGSDNTGNDSVHHGTVSSSSSSSRGSKNQGGVRLHFIDAASRSLLCAVRRTGSVELLSGYANFRTARTVSSFETVAVEERHGFHDFLSCYQPVSAKLLLSGNSRVSSWDLLTEQLVSVSERVKALDSDLTTVLAAHFYDPNFYSIGAGSTMFTFDARHPSAPCASYVHARSLCVQLRYLRRYPHLLAAGYGGGVMSVWDQRYAKQPVLEYTASCGSGNMLSAVSHVDIFSSCESFLTLCTSGNTFSVVKPYSDARPQIAKLEDDIEIEIFHPFKPLLGFGCGTKLVLC